MTKLFDNFSLEELTSSMASLMVNVNAKSEVWGETPERTPKQRPAITVREKLCIILIATIVQDNIHVCNSHTCTDLHVQCTVHTHTHTQTHTQYLQ